MKSRQGPNINAESNTDAYDVIVVGSGAAGGMSAYELTRSGLKVLMLEAGRDYDPETETRMFELPSQAPLRDVPTPDKPWGFFEADIGGFEMPDEPYTNAGGTNFNWYRSRMLGGRTNHWGRFAFRFGPHHFKGHSRDGFGVDWPLTYEDLAPWYDRTEQLIGVFGDNEGFENVPKSSPGILLSPPPPRASEWFVKRGCERLGLPVATIHGAVLTQPLNGRSACLYATDCMRGCAIGANFQSTTVLLPPALATKNLTIRTHTQVYQVDLDKQGLATGVSFVDRQTGKHHAVRARAVVLAASACETARILLNSKSSHFPDGLANESGHVGRHLADSVNGTLAIGQFPALERLPPRNDDGVSIPHIYVPWWGYEQQARKELDFPRGYQITMWGRHLMPDMDTAAYEETAYGPGLRDEIRRRYGSYFFFTGLGEMIPNDDTYCELDPTVKDKWGIPVLRFHWKWSEHELRQVAHQRKTFLEIIDKLGGNLVSISPEGSITMGGVHEAGTTRMGISPKDSVVNQFGQCWSVKNLFVTDGGVFASHPMWPTLTILALSLRSTSHLVEEARKGNL